ncbi:prepilin-type N-terminal cleavage/methylation domain-containing protein [Cerasicoccus maritimus]|uniref:prepilin-type N-terminal cleavage/methylation domain-containing protein n=1 Tax=Cerasicoccus maritimus TaxID=490089 RepID=UPI002852954F|nr:prepilin-type N-terminal cleavage/methylation domain-containing protein [Cerasicoccus maritimus]
MTTTTAHSKARRKGFSLAEMLIVTAVMGFFVTIATSSVVALSRSSTSLINYQTMNENSRLMLETFARDLRGATQVNSLSDTVLSIDTLTSDGTTQTVTYTYSSSAGLLYRQVGTGVRDILLDDIVAFDMNFYTFRGAETTSTIEAKRVQLEAMMERKVLTTTNTNYIISAQFVLRNHRVSS